MIYKKGFVLIELLIAASLSLIIAISVFSVFANGLNIWKKSIDYNLYETKTHIALKKFSRDLHNAVMFSAISFEGKEEEISFPSVFDNNIVRTTYFFDKATNTLSFYRESYPDLLQYDKQRRPSLLVSNVVSVKFNYSYLDESKKSYIWNNVWDMDGIGAFPHAVRIELMCKSKSKGEMIFHKIILIPIDAGKDRNS